MAQLENKKRGALIGGISGGLGGMLASLTHDIPLSLTGLSPAVSIGLMTGFFTLILYFPVQFLLAAIANFSRKSSDK